MLRRRHRNAEDQEFLLNAPVHARRLPPRLQEYVDAFRRQESGYGVIAGHPVDDDVIGRPRPLEPASFPVVAGHDLLLALYAALLGDAFGWATQQNGRITQDVLPIKEDEGNQLSIAPDVPLGWHTGDAFPSCRPESVLLACVRNPTEKVTTVARADGLELDEHDASALFEPRFRITPDKSHLSQHNSIERAVAFRGKSRGRHGDLLSRILGGHCAL
ncbi:hypothetical protein FHS29_006243 [Saccharothrix tamanrassetensis]|uniref:Uncharacterized protein n=1 Tax=Saccharothrix tamanrassetensis TaxID=1051531 RepID=A0A841CMC3_9PSEU|nr:hypothetical protein [Saccharothrix tamanrassetensis]MBB5959622.1 hypothetical protein [Saccharothrix tamanrassetensis]